MNHYKRRGDHETRKSSTDGKFPLDGAVEVMWTGPVGFGLWKVGAADTKLAGGADEINRPTLDEDESSVTTSSRVCESCEFVCRVISRQ